MRSLPNSPDTARPASLRAALAAALALSAPAACTGAEGLPSDPVLLAIVESRGPGEAARRPPRSWIGLAARGGGEVRLLTDDFWSAGPPSASFDGRRFVFSGRRRRDDPPSIWEASIDGSSFRVVTAGHGSPEGPIYLPDGRILFSDVPEAVPGQSGGRFRALFSCRADGSDLGRLTFGWHRDFGAELLADGRVRFRRQLVGTAPAPPPLLLAIHPDGTGVTRWSGSAAPRPAPPPGGLRVEAVPGRVVRAIEAAARRAPPSLTSAVREDVSTGTLLCLNAYESVLESVARLRPDGVRMVRVRRAEPAPAGTPPSPGRVILAEAPVHADGSFFLGVPADTPLQIELVGRAGARVEPLLSGIWVRPNENRGCIGCHEAPESAPENRVPLALVPRESGGVRRGGQDAR
ncbi:MAG: hypothetical protein ACE5JH_04270 [Acidobacteriota bacterium]